MSIKNFCTCRLGNKQKDIKYFKHLLPNQEDIDTVGEPFAGSFAVIRNCFYNVPNILCADNDIEFKKTIDNRLKNLPEYYEFVKKFTEFTEPFINRDKGRFILFQHKKIVKDWIEENKGLLNIDFERDLSVRGMIKPFPTTMKYDDLAVLYSRIQWFDDFKTVLDKLKDNNRAFVFLDPPYLSSDNSQYYGNIATADKTVVDNTGLFIDILNFFKTAKCKVMLVINRNAINEYIMKDYIKCIYSKQYSMSKRNDKLMVCTNYDIPTPESVLSSSVS
jgi:site-specific DNA-adenine methylase